MSKQRSNQNGASRKGTTGTRQGTQSTNAGSRSMSDMSGITVQKSQSSQHIGNLPDDLTYSRLIQAFAKKLGALVEWRKVELVDGREGYILFFPLANWRVDTTGELIPNE